MCEVSWKFQWWTPAVKFLNGPVSLLKPSGGRQCCPKTIQITLHHPPPWNEFEVQTKASSHHSSVITGMPEDLQVLAKAEQGALESLCSLNSLQWATSVPIKIVGDKKIHQEWQFAISHELTGMLAIHLLLLTLTATDCTLSLAGLIHTFCRCTVETKYLGHFSGYHPGNKAPRSGKNFQVVQRMFLPTVSNTPF